MSNEQAIYYDLHNEIYDETFTVCIEKTVPGGKPPSQMCQMWS